MKKLICCFLLLFTFLDASGLYYDKWSITWSPSGCPCIPVRIQNEQISVLLDTGCSTQLHLDEEVLSKIRKDSIGYVGSTDFRGFSYWNQLYLLKKVVIGSTVFKNVETSSIDPSRKKNTTLYSGEGVHSKEAGFVGIKLLKRKNLLLDGTKKLFIATNDMQRLSQEGYDVAAWISVPFCFPRRSLVIDIGTMVGRKRFLVDTGSAHSHIRQSEVVGQKPAFQRDKYDVFLSESFVIGSRDFGPVELMAIELKAKDDGFSGILGADFLTKQPIYFDFEKNVLWIYSQ